jgi:pyruvate formate lyase activating enzyme
LNALRGRVFDIKRDCSEDGPGIRTTVFFQGCPLRCLWCQNPEGQARSSRESQSYDGSRWYTLEKLRYRVLIDRPFFDSTGGGVTVSGGEPAHQMPFVGALLSSLQREGVDTAIETCGFFNYMHFEKYLLPYLNRIYFDLKIMDEAAHLRLTGQSNRPILANFLRLKHESALPVEIRVPLVPDITATAENLADIGAFLRIHGIHRVTLLPYNPLWQDKSVRMGRMLQLDSGFMTPEQLADCARQINTQLSPRDDGVVFQVRIV